jgi:threonine/homoserine efflux transporter RhtA
VPRGGSCPRRRGCLDRDRPVLRLLLGGLLLLNRLVGARLPGLQGTALATTISATGYLLVLAVLAISVRLTPAALGYALAAGTLASVIPYALDLIVLPASRRRSSAS